MEQVVTNSTVDGVLAAFFALLVVIIIADATRVCIQALRDPSRATSTEAPYVESRLVAPSGLIATREERELIAASAGGGGSGSGDDGGSGRHARSGSDGDR